MSTGKPSSFTDLAKHITLGLAHRDGRAILLDSDPLQVQPRLAQASSTQVAHTRASKQKHMKRKWTIPPVADWQTPSMPVPPAALSSLPSILQYLPMEGRSLAMSHHTQMD